MTTRILALAAAAALATASASAQGVFITEWMYSGDEFIEITNLSGSAVDMTGWSFDDDSRVAGTVSLSGFGIVQHGESVILAESAAADFRTAWSLAASVKVIGGNTANLGRNDEINIYDGTLALVDRLTFGDQNISGTIRTQNFSGWTTVENLGANDVHDWLLSSLGDAQNSYASSGTFIGNPGSYIPEPSTYAALCGVAALGFSLWRRRRKA